uniref:Uncharacterized protein n=1 Tax=Romanomermis culicivorax TaxID=13658 RepID=A0A915HLH4_ROMCU
MILFEGEATLLNVPSAFSTRLNKDDVVIIDQKKNSDFNYIPFLKTALPKELSNSATAGSSFLVGFATPLPNPNVKVGLTADVPPIVVVVALPNVEDVVDADGNFSNGRLATGRVVFAETFDVSVNGIDEADVVVAGVPKEKGATAVLAGVAVVVVGATREKGAAGSVGATDVVVAGAAGAPKEKGAAAGAGAAEALVAVVAAAGAPKEKGTAAGAGAAEAAVAGVAIADAPKEKGAAAVVAGVAIAVAPAPKEKGAAAVVAGAAAAPKEKGGAVVAGVAAAVVVVVDVPNENGVAVAAGFGAVVPKLKGVDVAVVASAPNFCGADEPNKSPVVAPKPGPVVVVAGFAVALVPKLKGVVVEGAPKEKPVAVVVVGAAAVDVGLKSEALAVPKLNGDVALAAAGAPNENPVDVVVDAGVPNIAFLIIRFSYKNVECIHIYVYGIAHRKSVDITGKGNFRNRSLSNWKKVFKEPFLRLSKQMKF